MSNDEYRAEQAEPELQVYRSGARSGEPPDKIFALPSSVGFSITQMIDRGFLDDCLQIIKASAAARQAVIAAGKVRQPPRNTPGARGPVAKRFGPDGWKGGVPDGE